MTRLIKKFVVITRLLPAVIAASVLLAATAYAAAPGVQGKTFSMSASASYTTQPDGSMIYSWGYSCDTGGTAVPFAPLTGSACGGVMQIPGPTLIVNEGDTVNITLTNSLPGPAGTTSILFPGFTVSSSGGVAGLLTQEAAPGGTVAYSFPTAGKAGTHSYYSGTRGDVQIEMGLFGTIIVVPTTAPAGCRTVTTSLPDGQRDYRLAAAAYDSSATCYDREYLFQFSEIDPKIHQQAEEQVAAIASCNASATSTGAICPTTLDISTEPYHPSYYLINGRSMPDDMDPNYAPQYPHQPYNGNPHMHPGELVLLRIVGQGRWQHPFHEHGNHVRILGRDGNLLLSAMDNGNKTELAGPLLFTTSTTPGQAMDGIYYWTGKGLNWDVYGHQPNEFLADGVTPNPAYAPCVPDLSGYYTSDPTAPNYYEWCADHTKPLEVHPFGDVGSGGPVTLPDSNILTNGPWYGGSPYLGADATTRAVGTTGTTPPSGTVANSPSGEAGFAFMWHSHNEREITTGNVFPGGMLMMMLVDAQSFTIDETQ